MTDLLTLGLLDYLILAIMFFGILWRVDAKLLLLEEKIEDKIEEFADELLPNRHEGDSFIETLVREGKKSDDK